MAINPTGEIIEVPVILKYQDANNASTIVKAITAALEKQGIVLGKNSKLVSSYVKVLKDVATLNATLQIGNKQVNVSGIEGTFGKLPLRNDKGQFVKGTAGQGEPSFIPNAKQQKAEIEVLGKATETLGSQVFNAAKRAAFTIPIWTLLRFAIGGLINNLIGAGALFVNFALDLDKSIAKLKAISTAAENSSENIEKISNTLKNLSLSSGKETKELGDALFDLKRAGLSGEDALLALQAVTDLSVGSTISNKDATLALVDAFNLLGPELEAAAGGFNKFNFVAGLFTALGNESSATAEEVVETFRKFVPIASNLNLTTKQILALSATMNQLGIRGAAASTALRQVFTLMQKNAPEVRNLVGKDLVGSFEDFNAVLQAIQKIEPNQRGNVFEAIFGVRGLLGPAAISKNTDALKKFEAQLDRLLENPEATSNIAGKQANDVRKNTGDLFKTIGAGLIQTVDSATRFSSTMGSIAKDTNEVANAFKVIRLILDNIHPNEILKKTFSGAIDSVTGEKDKKAIADARAQIKESEEQAKAIADTVSNAAKKEIQYNSFITQGVLEKIQAYAREKEAIEETSSAVDKRLKAQIRLDKTVQEFTDRINTIKGKRVTGVDEVLGVLNSADSEKEIKAFFKKIGLDVSAEQENELFTIFNLASTNANKLRQIQVADIEDVRRMKLDSALEEIEFLRVRGATEDDINKRRLVAIAQANVSWKELEQERIRQHKAELDRIKEISNELKSAFSTNLADLFKNKISLGTFATNFGDSIQNSIVDSTAKGLTNAFAGTGFFEQLGISGVALEDTFSKTGNVLTDSIVQGARLAAPILSGAIQKGAIGGAAGSGGGLFGGLAGLFGGGSGRPKGIEGPLLPNGKFSNSPQIGAGNILNAGFAAFGGFQAGSQRGTTQGLLGGAGGALTSLAPFLGPFGAVAGAALTIASFFGGKKKVTEETQEQTVQIASRINVTNKKLDIVNRNLVALRAVFETYVLPDSAYFSESRNLADQFSLQSRRGLIV